MFELFLRQSAFPFQSSFIIGLASFSIVVYVSSSELLAEASAMCAKSLAPTVFFHTKGALIISETIAKCSSCSS